MFDVKTILVPTDFSATSMQAVDHAKVLAETFGASLHLLHVLPDPHAPAWALFAYGIPVDQLRSHWAHTAEGRLDELLTAEVHQALRAVTDTRVGYPSIEIVRYAEAHQVDLIVLGTRGHGPVEHALLGSVAERVVRNAPCPVLTVPESHPS